MSLRTPSFFRRDVIASVACQHCKQPVGKDCITTSGIRAYQLHLQRSRQYRKEAGKMKDWMRKNVH